MAKDLYYSVTVDPALASYDLSGDLSSMTVDQREARPDHLAIELSDPFKVLSHALQEGMDIRVDAGTSEDHAVIFRGRIYRVDAEFPKDKGPTLRLDAYDQSMKMGLRKRSRVFTNMALSDVVAAVAGQPYFDQVNVNVLGDPSFAGNGIRQDDETDLAFLIRLARAYGCVAFVSVGPTVDTFNFVAQQAVMSSSPEVTLYHGRVGIPYLLASFESSADVSDVQLPRVLCGIDPNTGQALDVTTAQMQTPPKQPDEYYDENLTALRSVAPIKAAALETLLSSAKGIRSSLQKELGNGTRQPVPTFTTQAQMNAIAQNQFSTSLHGMRASGAAAGIRKLTACSSVAIEDVGGRFSGTWYLTHVIHTLDSDAYTTAFECRR